jgi:hypothetical protein
LSNASVESGETGRGGGEEGEDRQSRELQVGGDLGGVDRPVQGVDGLQLDGTLPKPPFLLPSLLH